MESTNTADDTTTTDAVQNEPSAHTGNDAQSSDTPLVSVPAPAEDTSAANKPSTEEPLPSGRFLDRELSWLDFNVRVLELAEDPNIPLLERARFLAIFASNLDEFFMVRVAGLKRRIATGIALSAASGLTPRQQLQEISDRAHELMDRHARVFSDQVAPALTEAGINLIRWDDLPEVEHERLREYFQASVFPVLTPLAVDPAHPFPYISGLSLNLAVVVLNPATEVEHFARVKVPESLPRFVEVNQPDPAQGVFGRPDAEDSPRWFVPIEDVIAANLNELFPGMEILSTHTFRVTRNEDLEVEEDDAENLLMALEKELLRRRFGPPVRLEVGENMDDHMRELLIGELGIATPEVYSLPGPLDLTGLNVIADLDRPELSYPAFVPRTHRHLAEVETALPSDVFGAIQARDILLHHPYDSFATSVQAFIGQAATDPSVLAIKQTLYRTSGDSPIIDALVDAAEAGKQVLAIVEIKARFDEQANITWARKLEQAGVHVVYGIVGLKTHCKLCLVVRQEADGLHHYAHVGTGNYNPKTARQYEDLGLLTRDPVVGDDIARLFNQLSGYARHSRFSRLLVAPRNIRKGLVKRIEREIEHARAGRPARIRMKANSIVDEATIDALYRASQAGVEVDLIIRGICAIRPGVPGLSENIRVRSILGRYLEHARIYSFDNDGEPEYFIGSADLMHRNLDRRVETLVSILEPSHQAELSTMLDRSMSDETATFHLGPDGVWTRHHLDAEGNPLRDIQTMYMETKPRKRRRLQRTR